MIPLVLCLHGTHDARLVALAAVVCSLGVYATYGIGNHAARSRGRERKIWAGVSVGSTGCTAWATHFILLMAYRPGVPAGFDPLLTALSLLVAVGVIGVGVVVVVNERTPTRRFLGGMIMALGIAGLHYLGQAAYKMQALIGWNVPLVLGSLVFSTLVAGVAAVASGARSKRIKLVSAPLLLLAIMVLHFSGMAAMTLFYDPARVLPGDVIAPLMLGPVMAVSAVCAGVLASIGLRFELIAKEKQRRTRDRLGELASVALEGLLVCDAGVILTVNKSFERLCGRDGRALKGRPASSLLVGLSLADMLEDEEYDAHLCVADGQLAPVRVLRRTVTAGARAQMVLAVRDQRERLRREAEREALLMDLRSALAKAEAANLAKSQFLANMSHEIRTPLNGVLGMAQALILEPLAPHQQAKVQTIQDAGRSLLILLNDILDLSKIEAGEFVLEAAPFDLVSEIQAACSLFAESAQSKGLSLAFTASDDVLGSWRGDSNRLRQIACNLLSNAIKFTTTGEVAVELACLPAGGLQLSIRDTGEGIAPDEIANLFAKFYQVDGANTRRFGGTGLGLSITRELCQMMGGLISVKSTLGRGSTFLVDLPLEHLSPRPADSAADVQRQAAFASPAAPDSTEPPEAEGGMRVLAAEDNPTNQLVLRALLQALQTDVTIVENGLLAVEAWTDGAFDLVFMDIQMPEMDGVSAARRIRALEAELGRARTPIVALTANVMSVQLEDYRRAGMDDCVAKPIQIPALSAALTWAAAPQRLNDEAHDQAA